MTDNYVVMTVREFAAAHKIGVTQIYREIAAGRLVARKLGRKTLITGEAAKAWRDALPVMKVA